MVVERVILFAHPLEAQPTIKRLDAQPQQHYYQFDGGKIVISGLGTLNAAIAVTRHAPLEVWNAGLAGSLCHLPIGTICSIAKVAHHLNLPDKLHARSRKLAESASPPVSLSGEHMLVSCAHGVQTELLRQELAQHYQLVDMEGYGVARACQVLGIPCRLIKIVSDDAGPNTSDTIQRRLPALAHTLCDYLIEELHSQKRPTLRENPHMSQGADPLSPVL